MAMFAGKPRIILALQLIIKCITADSSNSFSYSHMLPYAPPQVAPTSMPTQIIAPTTAPTQIISSVPYAQPQVAPTSMPTQFISYAAQSFSYSFKNDNFVTAESSFDILATGVIHFNFINLCNALNH